MKFLAWKKITRLKVRHPNAKLVAHPECEEPVLRIADFIGSTTQLLAYTKNTEHKEFIVATEAGILHQMVKQAPHKTFIPAPPDNACACNDCPHMKRNTCAVQCWHGEQHLYPLKEKNKGPA